MPSNEPKKAKKPTETTSLIPYGVIETSVKGKERDKAMDQHQ
jgi:hypothetical protein